MQVLGWHDSHCASVALCSHDGRILYAAAEERFTKRRLQKGFPAKAFEDVDGRFDLWGVERCYADLPLGAKVARNAGLLLDSWRRGHNTPKTARSLAGTLLSRVGRGRLSGIVGEEDGSAPLRVAAKRFRGVDGLSSVDGSSSADGSFGADGSSGSGAGFDGLCEHHTAHAACGYFLSGFERAWVVTIDGVGDCLSGTVFEGVGGRLELRRKFYYNDLTVGADYETLTAMLGFNPDRHCGKVTGLSARGAHNEACIAALGQFFERSWRRGARNYFDRMHGVESVATLAELRAIRDGELGCFSRDDLAYAMQHLAEEGVLRMIREHVPVVQGRNIALAGGVFANVRINQKIKELGFGNIFIAPPMDDGGLSLGAALHHLSRASPLQPHAVEHMFLGPGYDEAEIEEALDRAGASYERVDHMGFAVARLLAEGKVVGRFDGRMEFGPRALGNRSILYGTSDPSVNDWLNTRLRRSEFMPFAPATLADHADRCYAGLDGCRHAAEFMTITFDCTGFMKEVSPAVVHVDGTARAQLVRPEVNPGLYEVIDEYRKLTGIPSVVNTSFNMHESPIVASPEDAIRTFADGRLDYLAIGPFLAEARAPGDRAKSSGAVGRSTAAAV